MKSHRMKIKLESQNKNATLIKQKFCIILLVKQNRLAKHELLSNDRGGLFILEGM